MNINDLILDNPGIPVTEYDINELENYIGFSFPESYRQLLLKFNGGHLWEPFYEIPVENGEDVTLAEFFLSFSKDPKDTYGLKATYDVFQDGRFLKEYLPIISDPFGNKFYINLLNGQIGYYNHDTDEHSYLAKDLEEFFTLLNPMKEEEDD